MAVMCWLRGVAALGLMSLGLMSLGMVLLPCAALGGTVLPDKVTARVVSVTDGDTFRAVALVWPDIQVSVAVRISGIDAAEMRGKCRREKHQAVAARAALQALLPVASIVSLRAIRADKYQGRINAEVMLADGRDIAATLLQDGFARPYAGGRRQGWCP